MEAKIYVHNSSVMVAQLLKNSIDNLNSKHGVNICLHQYETEPLSIKILSPDDIIFELKKNIIDLFAQYTKQDLVPKDHSIYGYKNDKLLLIAKRVTYLLKILEDKTFSRKELIDEAKSYVEEVLEEVCNYVLVNYIKELEELENDFETYFKQSISIDNSKSKTLFRIYEDENIS